MENSLLKTAIMMIGEFEFDTIFNPEDGNRPLYTETAYIVFIIFVIVMSILIMNLLVSLLYIRNLQVSVLCIRNLLVSLLYIRNLQVSLLYKTYSVHNL